MLKQVSILRSGVMEDYNQGTKNALLLTGLSLEAMTQKGVNSNLQLCSNFQFTQHEKWHFHTTVKIYFFSLKILLATYSWEVNHFRNTRDYVTEKSLTKYKSELVRTQSMHSIVLFKPPSFTSVPEIIHSSSIITQKYTIQQEHIWESFHNLASALLLSKNTENSQSNALLIAPPNWSTS